MSDLGTNTSNSLTLTPTPTPPPPPKEDQKFSQDDLNRIAAKEKEEGRRSGERSLLEKLGFTTTEEAKAFFDKVKADQEAQMTEAEKKIKDADTIKRKAEELEAQAAQRLIEISVKSELVEAGLPRKDADMVKAMIQVDDNPDDAKVKERVKELKKAMPLLFADSQGGPPGSHPASPATKNDTRSPREKAMELLHQRHPETKKKE